IRRVLEQADVAGHQRRRGKSKQLPERKIPRHHCEHRSERLILDVALSRISLRRFLLQKSRTILRVKPATTRAFLDFCHRIAKQFAHLKCDDLSKSFLFLEQQLRYHVQQLRALYERCAAISPERFLRAV